MIEFEISELFGSFIIGLIGLYVVVKIFYYCIVTKVVNPFQEWINNMIKSEIGYVRAAIFTLIIFGLGLIIQDQTDRLTDSQSNSKLPTYFIRFENERFHRAQTLLKEKKNELPQFNPLAKELLYHKDYILYTLNKAEYKRTFELAYNTNNFFTGYKTKDSIYYEVQKFVNPLYYRAKNWCSEHPILSKEMNSIQRRIDFSRSLFLLLVIVFYITCITIFYIYFRRKNNPQRIKILKQNFIVLIIVVLLSIIANNAYAIAENNFNERVFGYYSSHLDEEENKLDCNPSLTDKGVLWMQISEEYKAICHQVYNNALHRIMRQTPYDPNRDAIIMDLDETVFDNSAFQAELIKSGKSYSKYYWEKFIAYSYNDNLNAVGIVPGAKEFISAVEKLGINVIYISNRDSSTRKETINTLRYHGINTAGLENVETLKLLLKENITSSKVKRRDCVQAKYNIIAYFGDNLSDFSKEFEERDINNSLLASKTIKNLGVNWFILPNPAYGGWTNKINDLKNLTLLDNKGFILE